MRVTIDAQILPGRGSGGVEQVIIGLVHALGKLADGEEEYVIIGPWQNPEWLKPYIGPNEQIVRGPRAREHPLVRVFRLLRPVALKLYNSRRLYSLSGHFFGLERIWARVPVSDGFYESLGCDIVHFPYQRFVTCALPTIYNPIDLQHLYYPQFFAPLQIAWRETVYPAGCHAAHTVVAISNSTKQDIVRHYGVEPDKVQVIPLAPATQTHPEPEPDALDAVREKYHLSTSFAFYPAMTWAHKNHIRLLEALALLRDSHGLKVDLVCTGHKNNFWPYIERQLLKLNLQGQAKFLGLVPSEDLRVLYRLAQFVVFPSLFEGAGLPVLEAWQEGTPVACSAVTSLPEYSGDAALLFDPLSVEAIARAIVQMATDLKLREDLRQRGARRLQDFSWERTAKAYRAVYRRAAGCILTEEDHWLLSWDWMREPQRKTGVEL